MSTRFARVCLEESLKFAGKRKTFGKTLIQHPVIRWKVAEMARMVEATHNWLEWITFQLNTMPKLEAMLKLGGHTALCKVQCTKAPASAPKLFFGRLCQEHPRAKCS